MRVDQVLSSDSTGPKQALGQARAGEQPNKMNGPAINRKALIVDCDQETLALTAEALHSFAPGFDVATANDPSQAIAWLETFHPDVLLMSKSYSDADGSALSARVRADERTKHCKIIVVSEAVLGERGEENHAPGADATLVKPLRLPLLLQTVRRVLDH